MATKDQTAQQPEHILHSHPHPHADPGEPHLLVEWIGHGPDDAHLHKHIVGGPNPYNHADHDHDDDDPGDDPDDNSGLKLDGQRADNNNSSA